MNRHQKGVTDGHPAPMTRWCSGYKVPQEALPKPGQQQGYEAVLCTQAAVDNDEDQEGANQGGKSGTEKQGASGERGTANDADRSCANA